MPEIGEITRATELGRKGRIKRLEQRVLILEAENILLKAEVSSE